MRKTAIVSASARLHVDIFVYLEIEVIHSVQHKKFEVGHPSCSSRSRPPGAFAMALRLHCLST